MPPIYDDYIDESGFGRVSTLGSDDPTILEDVESYCDNYNHETCHLDLNFQSHDSYFVEFAPTIIHEKNFAYVESSKFSMLVDHDKNALCDGYIV